MVVAFPDGGRQGPRAYAIGTNTQKFKKIKGPCTTTSKSCLINYACF